MRMPRRARNSFPADICTRPLQCQRLRSFGIDCRVGGLIIGENCIHYRPEPSLGLCAMLTQKRKYLFTSLRVL